MVIKSDDAQKLMKHIETVLCVLVFNRLSKGEIVLKKINAVSFIVYRR